MRFFLPIAPVYTLLYMLAAPFLFSDSGIQNPPGIKSDSAYILQIQAWHHDRISALKKEEGWLNLVGLYWLKEGKNTFGSSIFNDIVFPVGKIPAQAGAFFLHSGEVKIEVSKGVQIAQENNLVREQEIYTKDQDKPAVLKHGSLRWSIIRRGNKYGIRLRDLESPTVKHFKGIKTFQVDQQWRIEATLIPHLPPKKIPVTDVLGIADLKNSPGTLVFTVHKKSYRLDAIENENELFVIFADQTNGKETYGAGRFVYADKPDVTGKTILDFNKAINPPCAFTAYATCPLPPKQNFLPIAVRAGERSYEDASH